MEGRCFLWCPSGCERAERKSPWGEWGRNILEHLSSPLRIPKAEVAKWWPSELGCIVFKRKENDITCQHLQSRVFTQISEFPDFLGKIIDLATWSWHSLLVSCGRSWAAAACCRWDTYSPGGLSATTVSCIEASQFHSYTSRPWPGGTWVCDLQEHPWRGTFGGLQLHSQNQQHHIWKQ